MCRQGKILFDSGHLHQESTFFKILSNYLSDSQNDDRTKLRLISPSFPYSRCSTATFKDIRSACLLFLNWSGAKISQKFEHRALQFGILRTKNAPQFMCLKCKHPLVSNSILTDETWESVAYLVMSELFLTRISEECGLKLGSQRLRKSSKSVFQLISKLHLILCSSRYHSQLLKTFFDFKQENF